MTLFCSGWYLRGPYRDSERQGRRSRMEQRPTASGHLLNKLFLMIYKYPLLISIRSKSKLYLLFIDYPFRQLQTSSTTQTTRPLRPTDFFSTCPSGSRRSFSARPIGVSGTCSAKPNRPPETSTTTLERGRARTEKLRTNPETIARIKARMTRRAVWKPYEMAGKVMAEKVREKVMDIVMPTETMLTDTTKMMILTTTKSLKRKLLTKVKKTIDNKNR